MAYFKILFVSLFLTLSSLAADPKPLPSLPLWDAENVVSGDSLIFVNSGQSNLAHRLYLWDLVNLPPFSSSSYVLGKTLTGFSSTTGTVTSSDTVLSALNKIYGNLSAIGGAPITIGAINSQTPASNGLLLDSNILYAQYASATAPGMVSNGTQDFSGQKTFTTGITGTLTGTASGNELPLSFSDGLNRSTNAINCVTASGSAKGCLSSADWSTFNGKQAALTIGDLTVGTGLSVSGGTSSVIGSGAAVSIASGHYLPTTSDQTAWNAKLDSSAFTDSAVTGKVLTGFTAGSGTVAATDTILQAIQKVVGNISAISIPDFDDLSPMDAEGDLIIGGTAGAAQKLAAEDDGDVLTLVGGVPAWAPPSGGGGGGSLISKDISQTGHGFTVGEAIYFDGTDYDEAQADDDTTSEVVGVVSAVADANNFTMVMAGEITGLSGLTAGTTYYLSEATAGLLTATAPTGVGEVSKPVLVASSTTGGYVIQSRGAIISDGSGGGGGTITDWESDNDVVVPDTFGTVSNFRGFKKRIGDSLTVRFNFTTGTVPSSTSTFSLGDSLVIDEAKLSSGGMGQQVGRCMTLGGTDTAFVNDGGHDVVIFYDGSDETKLYVAYIITSGAYKKVTTNNLIGSSTNIDCRIEDLPIVGW